MRAAVVGAGAVGARAARQLHSTGRLLDLVVTDVDTDRAAQVAASLGRPARPGSWGGDIAGSVDVVVLALPVGGHRGMAETSLEGGAHVVSVSDDVDEVARLLDLDAEARERRRSVVVGAGFAPGLSCLLARHAAADLSCVDEVHVARSGTGGPACARHHHRALGGQAADWRDGVLVHRRAGSGRELCWFPDPVGALDCYRAALPDPWLLRPAFPDAGRITARLSASRRDRVTARLPMLRRPHAEAALGAVRVEVRGRRGQGVDARILGAIDRPAMAAGAVAAAAAMWAVHGRYGRDGAGGLAELVPDPLPFLRELADRGVRAAVFEGTASA